MTDARFAAGRAARALASLALLLLAVGGEACVQATAKMRGMRGAGSRDLLEAFPGLTFRDGWTLEWRESFEALSENRQPPQDTWDHYCGPVSESRWIKVCFIESPLLPEPYSMATIHFNENRLYQSFLAFPAKEIARVRTSVEERIGKPAEELEEVRKSRVGGRPVNVLVARWKGESISVELRSQGASPGQGRLAITYLPIAPSIEAESPL